MTIIDEEGLDNLDTALAVLETRIWNLDIVPIGGTVQQELKYAILQLTRLTRSLAYGMHVHGGGHGG
jgi:hypothetical protein